MTAVSHDGVSGNRLRSSAGSIRNRVGSSRLVRPGSASTRTTSSGAPRPSEPVGTAHSVAAGGAATAASSPLGINLGALTPGTTVGSLRLVLAGRRVRLGSGAFLLLVLGLLSSILVSLLLLNTALAENSFQLQDIRQTARDLTVREQTLSSQLAAAESPIGLEAKAKELGMVAASSPVFLRLEDGKILGESAPAQIPPAAKQKKPKAPKATDPFAGEFPVGQNPTLAGELAAGSGAGLSAGELALGSAPSLGSSEEFTPAPPVGGESPVGVSRGATQ